MVRIDIKPLSVNKAYYGKLTKTSELRKYTRDLGYLLPTIKLPEPPYHLYIKWGFSSKGSDWDNPIKPLQDCLADKYGFNDNQVYEAHIVKKIVPKGQEYIKFSIKHYEV